MSCKINRHCDNKKIIGIVGGVGPYAGLDLCQKIYNQTNSIKDQNHLSIALLSSPSQISDRTAYLLGEEKINPAYSIVEIIRKLELMGASVIGIPCNASHAPQIFNVIYKELMKEKCKVKLLHLIYEVACFIEYYFPDVKNVGILSVNGTYKSQIYKQILETKGLNVIMPDENIQINYVHKSIYDSEYGIKAHSNPTTKKAKKMLFKAIEYLQNKNADAIVLGCTEIPLVISEKAIGNTIIIDTNLVMARALIRETAPDKLKPLKLPVLTRVID